MRNWKRDKAKSFEIQLNSELLHSHRHNRCSCNQFDIPNLRRGQNPLNLRREDICLWSSRTIFFRVFFLSSTFRCFFQFWFLFGSNLRNKTTQLTQHQVRISSIPIVCSTEWDNFNIRSSSHRGNLLRGEKEQKIRFLCLRLSNAARHTDWHIICTYLQFLLIRDLDNCVESHVRHFIDSAMINICVCEKFV